MKRVLIALLAFVGFAAPVRAQIPVTDVASLTQQIQQVLSWGQQYTQMVDQINNQLQQIDQLQNTYNSMTGARGLGSFLNGAGAGASRRYLPADMAQIYDLYSGTIVPGFNALSTRINALRSTISTLPPGYFPGGSQSETELNRLLDSIGTQRTMAETAYRATTDRIPNVEAMLTRINSTTDPKEIAELQARISGEQVIVQNDANRIALLRYQQEVQRQEQEQRQLESLARAARAPIGTVTFTTPTF